ncbi:hypothetical protein MmarC5_1285 [Methanococcus maripaludis C5]|uniref:Transposon-encoded protein n=2 Tax=Methanococcus maripaludis TaxID=39152 RepID=A4FZE9_METM5|nr:hypothetical protein MmarC5_1285 [Methanococcus maripaludis C5]
MPPTPHLKSISKEAIMKEKTIIKQVKPSGNTGHVTLPKKLIGKKVKITIKEGENKDD